MLDVSRISKRYGDKLAVNDVSFKVERGEIVGFLGPNGAGKSTTMNIITGFLSASDGSVAIDGDDILERPREARRKIGYLPEQPPLYVDMTVDEYLGFIYELKKVSLPRAPHISEICGVAGIVEVRGRVIKNLSKGYRQRVGLAGALLGNPDLLILDEPTVGLDPTQIVEIRGLIKSLGERHTILLSSHILPEVEAVCERVIVINHGRLVADGSPEELSRSLAGEGSFHIRVGGNPEAARLLLEGVSGVGSVRLLGRRESAASEFLVTPLAGSDPRSASASALVGQGFELLALRRAELSLEDIFMQLVKEDAQP